MARIRIDDLPLGEKLTPEQEELILGAGRQTFRPMLESLESRDMPDAGMGGAVTEQMMSQVNEGAQVRQWEQAASSLQNQFNQISQLQAQQGQAIMVPPPQFNQTSQTLAGQLLWGVGNQNHGLSEVAIENMFLTGKVLSGIESPFHAISGSPTGDGSDIFVNGGIEDLISAILNPLAQQGQSLTDQGMHTIGKENLAQGPI